MQSTGLENEEQSNLPGHTSGQQCPHANNNWQFPAVKLDLIRHYLNRAGPTVFDSILFLFFFH